MANGHYDEHDWAKFTGGCAAPKPGEVERWARYMEETYEEERRKKREWEEDSERRRRNQ